MDIGRIGTPEEGARWKRRALELTEENKALWAFVEADDKHQEFRQTTPDDGMELWISEWEYLRKVAKDRREALRPYEKVDVVEKPLPLA